MAAVRHALRRDRPPIAQVEEGNFLAQGGTEVVMAEVAGDAVAGVGQENVVQVRQNETSNAEIDKVEAATVSHGRAGSEQAGSYASVETSWRNSSGDDSPVENLAMMVINSPKMRFCEAMPTPEASAAATAIAWSVYSNGPA